MNDSIRFVHSSDLQIGMTRRFLSPEAQARFEDDRVRSIELLSQVAVEKGCSFIVLAGDVFEYNSLSQRIIGRVRDVLKQVEVPVYLLPGNHDPLTANSVLDQICDLDQVHVIRDSSVVSVSEGVELVGAPLYAKTATEDLVKAALEDLNPTEAIRIAVGHGQVDSRGALKPDLIDLGFVEEKLADGTIDYLALGDTHSATSLGATGRVWFSGAPETTAFHDLDPDKAGGEVNSGKALVVSLSKTDVSVEQVTVGKWIFEAFSCEVNSAEDIEQFLSRLRQYQDKSRTVVKYGLQGAVSLAQYRMLEEGIAELEEVFAALVPRDRTTNLTLLPDEQELEDLEVSGYAAEALMELKDEVAQHNRPVDRDALNLLFRLSKEN